MIDIGKKQVLKVVHEDESGYYLACTDGDEVFMPGSLVSEKRIELEKQGLSFEELQAGSMLQVFVYLDKEGSPLATPNLPKHEVGDLAILKVEATTPHGAFLNIGTPKDILVPRKLQQFPMASGELHLVKILLEEETERIYGTSKVAPYIVKTKIPLKAKQSVKLVPYRRTPLGYKILVDDKYLGMIYHNEVFCDVVLGIEYQGSVKGIREDGQVDSLLKEVGVKAVKSDSGKILDLISSNNNRLNLWDKSSPEEIERQLNMSKKAFKKAVGMLYKERKITLGKGFISSAN